MGAVMRIIGLVCSAAVLAGLGIWWMGNDAQPPESVPEKVAFSVSPEEICRVDAAKPPVLRTEKREVVVADAYKQLAVSPAEFGMVEAKVTLTPAHKQGATFFTEPTRVIVAEPTRRLTVKPAQFLTVPAIDDTTTQNYRVENGELIDEELTLSPIPERQIVTKQASIMSVRFTPGFKTFDVKEIDQDGDGPQVPAEIIIVERRTVEVHPKVTTTEVAERSEIRDVQIVAENAELVRKDAFCSIKSREDFISAIRSALVGNGAFSGPVEGGWDSALIDSMAAFQQQHTGYISPALLLETLQALVPETEIPTS